jgi:hypothetical protein
MPTATYGLSPAVSTQKVRPMDLLTSSGSSVTVAAAGKAVGIWAAWRPFGGVDNGQFAMSMGTVGRGGQIRRSHRHSDALIVIYIFVEGQRGRGVGVG